MAQVLIIDDDPILSAMLAELAADMGHGATQSFTLEEGLRQAALKPFSAILLDVRLPDGNGLVKIGVLRDQCPSAEVIIMTGYGDGQGAELALESGAWDYIWKTDSTSEIRLSLSRAIQYAEARASSQQSSPDLMVEGIVGTSGALRNALTRLAQAAKSDANVLITGETGTGKELFAWAVHSNSRRSGGPFVTVDCASLPPTLVESVLFGHERGAFTGADRKTTGLIFQANGGTLFLDEIGDLPLAIQKAFLRVLQEKRFRPVGGREEHRSDFRTVAATHRDLAAMVEEKTFRGDLLHRLRSLTIQLPPLREHPLDIPDLTRFHNGQLCKRYGIAAKEISAECLEYLVAYPWPGNVRELVNVMESAIAAAFDEPVLYPKHLPTRVRLHLATRGRGGEETGLPPLKTARERAIVEAEDQYLRKLVLLARGDLNEACRIAGLSRPQLYAQLKKHGLSLRDPSPAG